MYLSSDRPAFSNSASSSSPFRTIKCLDAASLDILGIIFGIVSGFLAHIEAAYASILLRHLRLLIVGNFIRR